MNNLSIIDNVDNSTVAQTLKKIAQFQALVRSSLKPGQDFDVIPGSNKPSLLKPGAEKITMLLGVNPQYEFLEKIEDFKNEFFSYNIRCTLYNNGAALAQGLGSCNSKEKKYRYINVDQNNIPQNVDIATLESFTDRHGNIKYKLDNPDICSLVNTILKMAKKRAFIDATLQLAALSEIFSQDLEDIKEFLFSEKMENLTIKDAQNTIVNFGTKHKGKTLETIYKEDKNYIIWLSEKARDEAMKKACKMLIDENNQQEKTTVEEVQNDSENPLETPF